MHPVIAKRFSQWVGIECYLAFMKKYEMTIGKDIIVDNLNKRINSKEHLFGRHVVAKLFKGYTILKQYKVLNGKYIVDWYIPKLKLVIEFNEKHHSRTLNSDTQRKLEIESSLGCSVLTYNDFN